MKNNRSLILTLGALALTAPLYAEESPAIHMANGIKIGEVTPTSAIVWTRLTRNPERNVDGKPFPNNVNRERKSQSFEDLAAMEGSMPGVAGEVRVGIRPADGDAAVKFTDWKAVAPEGNFTCQFPLGDLQSGAAYTVVAEGRSASSIEPSCSVAGSFRTAADSETPAHVRFTVVTGQDYPRRDDPANGHKIYPQMQKLDPDFFVHTGDIEYYDKPQPYADNIELARFKWNRLYALPFQRDFHNRTASYFMKDDHDTLRNDCWPGQAYGDLTWEQGLALFPEQVPMGEKTYRTVRWGKDLQVWFVEGRDYRSPNKIPDGPEKTIWGEEQKRWFFETVRRSNATFRILISPTPVVGPDRGNKNDNHANKGFTHEGDELRKFIAAQKNMFVVCGDRHWQYVSRDPETGVREYSCGPTTNKHATGFSLKNRSEMHQYLKIRGGFLRVDVDRVDGKPQLAFRHHGVDGEILNEDIQHGK